MRRCFADSFFFFAWWNRRDLAHLRVEDFLKSFDGLVVTTSWVLMEVADGLASSPARRKLRRAFEDLKRDPGVLIIEANESLGERGLGLYDSRPDKAWSLTDCVSFIVMADEGLAEALTGDKHFEQAGFVALLK